MHRTKLQIVQLVVYMQVRLAAQAARLGGFKTFWPGGGFRNIINLCDPDTGPTINMARPQPRGPQRRRIPVPTYPGRSAQLTRTRTARHSLAPSTSYGVISCY